MDFDVLIQVGTQNILLLQKIFCPRYTMEIDTWINCHYGICQLQQIRPSPNFNSPRETFKCRNFWSSDEPYRCYESKIWLGLCHGYSTGYTMSPWPIGRLDSLYKVHFILTCFISWCTTWGSLCLETLFRQSPCMFHSSYKVSIALFLCHKYGGHQSGQSTCCWC